MCAGSRDESLDWGQKLILTGFVLLVFTALALMGAAVWVMLSKEAAKEAAKVAQAATEQQDYARSLGAKEFLEVNAGEKLSVRSEYPLRFRETLFLDSTLVLSSLGEAHVFSMKTNKNGEVYGDVDLTEKCGIPARLHVVSATEERMKYAVRYYDPGAENSKAVH